MQIDPICIKIDEEELEAWAWPELYCPRCGGQGDIYRYTYHYGENEDGREKIVCIACNGVANIAIELDTKQRNPPMAEYYAGIAAAIKEAQA